MTQKKQRPGGQQTPPAEARSAGAGSFGVPSAPGVRPAGREVFAESAPRRRSEATLAALGLETALDTVNRLEAAGDRTAAAALREWVNTDPAKVAALLRQLPGTRGGQSRELRLSMCGVAFLARRAGVVGFARRCCKDRLCPFCAARRSRMFAAALREYLDANPWRWRIFLTVTQRKVALESPRAAMDRLLAAWRRFTERFARTMLRGGVRAMEVTARKRDTWVGDYQVKVPGVHAHLHCVVDARAPWCLRRVLRRPTRENKRGDLMRRPRVTLLAAAWNASSPRSDAAGVDIQNIDDENTYQVAKYPVDMSGLVELVDGAASYVRAVLGALHGRRTVALFGAWRGADLGLREKAGTLEYGDRALYTLATGHPGEAADVHWASGEVEPAEAVLASLLAGPREPLAGQGAQVGQPHRTVSVYNQD